MIKKILMALFILFLTSPLLQAAEDIPRALYYQGRISDGNNVPVSNNTYNFTFVVRESSYGWREPLIAEWGEAQDLSIRDGFFGAKLGQSVPFPIGYFNDDSRYLDIIIFGDGGYLMGPWQRMLSVPYAFNAATLMGRTTDYFVSTAAVNQTLSGTKTFTSHPRIQTYAAPTLAEQYAPKKYVDDLVAGGLSAVLLSSTQTFTAQNTFAGAVTISSAARISGNLGIGTTSPQRQLHLHTIRSGMGYAMMHIATEGTGVLGNFYGFNVPRGLEIYHYGNDAAVSQIEDSNLLFGTNNSTQMVILPNGNIGLGTSNPSSQVDIVDGSLVVRGPNANILIDGYDVMTKQRYLDQSSSTQTKTGGLVIDGGRLGIGVTNPGAWLDVGGGILAVTTSSVGVGTLEPAYKLDVNGILRTTGNSYFTTAGGSVGVGTE
ncbi:MAG: hypothetical protein HY610_03965, partial [Elusimicrobia bacterium]|nr:hypothetical protein [Elusimicrobiota bacterium]